MSIFNGNCGGGGVINVDGAPDGNILVTASAPGNVTDLVGGYEGMWVHLKAATVHPQTLVYDPAKLVMPLWSTPSVQHILYDDTATGGGPGHGSFVKVNGAWLMLSYAL